MKQALRIVLRIAAVLALCVFAFVGYCAVRGIPRYEVTAPSLTVELTPERIERGKKFASLLCAECHADPKSGRLTGRKMRDLPPEFGEVYSRNITQDREHGIGAWTDGELALLLRTGITRDGEYLPPWMPKLSVISDEDLASIIAFLRSDDPQVVATAVDPPGRTKPSLLSKILGNTVFGPLPYPTAPIVTPDETQRVEYGRYLVQTLDCWACHSPDVTKLDSLHPERTPGYLSGGNPMLDAQGDTVYTANLTFDEKTGLGGWSEQQFIEVVRTGLKPNGRALRSPMAPRPQLTDAELSAMYAYLKTVPRIERDVPENAPFVPKSNDPGQRAYYTYGCAGCHGDTGRGIADLRTANEHYPTDDALIAWIKNAPSLKPGTTMPKWEGVIPESAYSPLARYVRSLASQKGQGPLSRL